MLDAVGMEDVPADRAPRVIALLQDAVGDELRVAADLGGIDLTTDQLELLTAAVTYRLEYAFSFDWRPHWVKPGGTHSWSSADGYRARCGVCLLDSPPSQDQGPAVQWARNHEAGHHR